MENSRVATRSTSVDPTGTKRTIEELTGEKRQLQEELIQLKKGRPSSPARSDMSDAIDPDEDDNDSKTGWKSYAGGQKRNNRKVWLKFDRNPDIVIRIFGANGQKSIVKTEDVSKLVEKLVEYAFYDNMSYSDCKAVLANAAANLKGCAMKRKAKYQKKGK